MSVMDELSNVVSAARDLLDTVSGKMQQIDSKVDAATQAVPDTIRSMAEQMIYVDAENGDDSNDGSQQHPLKTVTEAQSRHVSGSYSRIGLKEGQTHATVGSWSSIPSGIIAFRRWGDTSGINNPIAKNTTEYHEGSGQNRGRFISLSSGVVIFESVDVESVDVDNGEIINTLDGFIYTYLSNVAVFFLGSTIRLDSRSLIGTSKGGRTGLSLYLENSGLEIISNRGSRSRLILGGNAVYSLGVGDFTLPSGYAWSDLIPVNADAANIHTNLDTTSL